MTSPPRAITVVIRPGAMVVAWFVRRTPRQSGPLLGCMERGPRPGTPPPQGVACGEVPVWWVERCWAEGVGPVLMRRRLNHPVVRFVRCSAGASVDA